ncbi:MAG TPA: hypothetical protein DEH78_19815 [Solibacterales bacterium]|nr:hypothetical protein [Bryobacterales bacterium]
MRRERIGACGAAVALAAALLAQDAPEPRFGEVLVTADAVLKASPSNSSPVIRLLAAGTVLQWIEGQTEQGFLRVLPERGAPGWIDEDAVTVRQRFTPPAAAAPGVTAAAPACAADLDACRPEGCAPPGSTHALSNQAKRFIPAAGAPLTLKFRDFALLQEKAAELVGQSRQLSQQERQSIAQLPLGAGVAAGEGTLVRLVGYIAQGLPPHPNSGESVNCRLRGQQNNDIHIAVAQRPGQDEFAGIVTEMIPQGRDPRWTSARLTAVRAAGRKVMLTGGLFYDNLHVVNPDRNHPLSGHPKRFSLWEIHPVTALLVCRRTNQAACQMDRPGDWTPLEQFTP